MRRIENNESDIQKLNDSIHNLELAINTMNQILYDNHDLKTFISEEMDDLNENIKKIHH